MVKGKHTLVKLLIIVISFFCLDGGRSILFIGNNIQILIDQDHIKDIDIPHQLYSVSYHQEEKWLESYRFDFSCFITIDVKYLYKLNIPSQEFPDSIWQPPKFV
jgi:hypothetical protein